MAYEKTTWVDGETEIDAQKLNKMEEGIVEASQTGGILTGSIVAYDGDTIPEGYEEVDISSAKILWQNPNPTSSQEAQTITLNSDDYDELEWFFQPKANENQLTSVRSLKGWNPCVSVGYCGTAGVVYRDRNIMRNSDTSFHLADGRTATGATARTTDNSCCVITYVVGRKTGILS